MRNFQGIVFIWTLHTYSEIFKSALVYLQVVKAVQSKLRSSCLAEKVFSKISVNSQKNACALFFNNVTGWSRCVQQTWQIFWTNLEFCTSIFTHLELQKICFPSPGSLLAYLFPIKKYYQGTSTRKVFDNFQKGLRAGLISISLEAGRFVSMASTIGIFLQFS